MCYHITIVMVDCTAYDAQDEHFMCFFHQVIVSFLAFTCRDVFHIN